MTTTQNPAVRNAEHTARIDIAKLAPDMYKAMYAFSMKAGTELEPELQELVKIRASQLNHCAFCLDMHTKDTLAAGESVERVIQLSAWHEARHFYTAREVAAIELTESVTVLADGFVPDDVWERAAEVFTDEELAQLVGLIVVINSWNRFAVSSRAVPGHYQPRTR